MVNFLEPYDSMMQAHSVFLMLNLETYLLNLKHF